LRKIEEQSVSKNDRHPQASERKRSFERDKAVSPSDVSTVKTTSAAASTGQASSRDVSTAKSTAFAASTAKADFPDGSTTKTTPAAASTVKTVSPDASPSKTEAELASTPLWTETRREKAEESKKRAEAALKSARQEKSSAEKSGFPTSNRPRTFRLSEPPRRFDRPRDE
jgi:hypothetical protein